MTDEAEPTEIPKLFIRERMRATKPHTTAKVLADRMETSEAQISRLLNGKRRMTLEWLFAFSKALTVPINALFSEPGAGEPQDAETRLRLALLAFGVDREDLGRAVSSVRVFLDDPDEQSSRGLPDDQSELANPRRAKEPT